MAHEGLSGHLAASLQHARQHWQQDVSAEVRGNAPADVPAVYTIALSRESGTGGRDIAQRVAERLGWTVYDRELVEHIARDAGCREELVASLDEQPANWFRAFSESLLQLPTITAEKYLKHLVQTLMSLASHGNCVLVGRGATAVLPPQTTVRVRLIAPLEDRVSAVAAKHQVSEKEARSTINETDRSRREFVQSRFHQDVCDPHVFDLVLNTSRLTPDGCADLIVEALRHRQSGE